ncbi:YegS/Rv2252/BmrU family lipid kinase [Bacillota bacterium LX-D]|nr:YegS/Rv2252/BmrU family lipid kinase [Bacillota bacterium LX-D]
MERALLIYNPFSGDRGVVNRLDLIIRRLQEKNIFIVPYRLNFRDSFLLVQLLQQEKFDFIIISGGDGTLNSVVNILLSNNIHLPIGLIPAGTCNDFARCLGLPTDLNLCLELILAGRTMAVDVGLINEKQYFLSSCAGGNFADVSFNTQNELKKHLGPFAYYLKALSEVTSIKSFNIKLETEQKTWEEEVLLFLVLNGKHAAGFSNLIDCADFTDGIMDIVLVKNCNHLEMASLFFKVLSSDALNDKDVTIIRTSICNIYADSSIATSIDGEKGSDLPFNIRFLSKRLEILI